jgi:hypothetical protein
VIGLFLAILRTLHLGRQERCGVVIFLTISAIPVLAAILRLAIVIVALRPAGEKQNPQRFQEILYLASQIEVTTAFIAACLPAMRVFVRQREEKQQRLLQSRSAETMYKNAALRAPQPAFTRTPTHATDDSYWQEDIELENGSNSGLWPPEHGTRHQ